MPLRDGLGSIVTYTDGSTDIGSWHGELPSAGRTVASVRQNLTLLIDHGRPAANQDCISCWGATLGGISNPARSALGITRDGHLIWAGGEHLTVAQLADLLLGARVVRAVELDINPEWVAAYLYGHRASHGPLTRVPIAPGQPGTPGQFLAPYSRDFFTRHAPSCEAAKPDGRSCGPSLARRLGESTSLLLSQPGRRTSDDVCWDELKHARPSHRERRAAVVSAAATG